MEKSIFSDDYKRMLRLLRLAREQANLTQEDVAIRIGQTQSFVSKCERGERRIDIFELIFFCEAIGINFLDFVSQLQKER